MLRDRQKNEFCVACTQFPKEPEKPVTPEPQTVHAGLKSLGSTTTMISMQPGADRMAFYGSGAASTVIPTTAVPVSTEPEAAADDGLGGLASRVLKSLQLSAPSEAAAATSAEEPGLTFSDFGMPTASPTPPAKVRRESNSC